MSNEQIRDPEAYARSNEAKVYRLRAKQAEAALEEEKAARLVERNESEARLRKLETSRATPEPPVPPGQKVGSRGEREPTSPPPADAPLPPADDLDDDALLEELKALRSGRLDHAVREALGAVTMDVAAALDLARSRGVEFTMVEGRPHLKSEDGPLPISRESVKAFLPTGLILSGGSPGSGSNAPKEVSEGGVDMKQVLNSQAYFEAHYDEIKASRRNR